MSCYGCVCRFCARSVELEPGYFTPGELPEGVEACFACDECYYYGGDRSKGYQWRPECSGMIEARKYLEAKARAQRAKLRIVK